MKKTPDPFNPPDFVPQAHTWHSRVDRGVFFALWLLGFPLGIPLATFLYLKVAAHERWLTSIVVTAGTWAFIVGVFGHFLDFVFPDPALLSFGAYILHR